MVKAKPIVVTVIFRPIFSLWNAIKIRIAGFNYCDIKVLDDNTLYIKFRKTKIDKRAIRDKDTTNI